jgi:mTERF
LINEYGFVKEEINFITKHKPTFVLAIDTDKSGIHIVKKVFIDDKGFPLEYIRTLILKYPYILGKTEEELTKYFDILNGHGLTND